MRFSCAWLLPSIDGRRGRAEDLDAERCVHCGDPSGVDVELQGNTNVVVRSVDKHACGQFAANVRAARKPEPYKGKGVRYAGEVVRRKAGKAGKIGGA